ncbi:flagellar biosynthesis regulator FlaF [Brevundimonas sp. GCM10030266]|jgi:flagellar protein FlaF|uniref:flagellar biosynthesis regulator FlaF n=1 Tax=Brevundimonas sp. GCM10030266 TaxID=3273386 RepID=UPI00361C2907
MSLQAYKTAATRAESPREAEYRLFGQVTRALMHASTVDPSDVKTRIEALDWNRRLWSALATDCSDPGNAMAMGLRAQIISISLFVGRHSSEIMRGDNDFETLIEINKSIMQGLAGPGQQAA